MHSLPQTRSCFVCGRSNPAGLKLSFRTDGTLVQTQFTPDPVHTGFSSTVHGGILATVLDEIMVWACAIGSRKFAYCAELTVRYVRPARPGVRLTATARLVQNRRGRLFETSAELSDPEGRVIATSTGKYMPVEGPIADEVLREFDGAPRSLDEMLAAPGSCIKRPEAT